jgi:hypothetical protein
MEGKVKQILSDHAIVQAEGSNYLVQKSVLSTKPVQKTASVTTIEGNIIKTAFPAQKEMAIPKPLRQKVSQLLWDICSNKYYQSIPIAAMSDGLNAMGIEMENDFILTGRDGRATLSLTMNGQPISSMIALQWHKMEETGNYEVNAYLT